MPALINMMAARGFFGGSAPAVTPGPTNLIPLMLDGSHTVNSSAGVTVSLVGETYRATIAAGDASSTTHYNASRGRFDYLSLTGNFVADFLNTGMISGATLNQYQFCGVSVSNVTGSGSFGPDYMFFLPGQRGTVSLTGEYKETQDDQSRQDDIGENALPTGRADVRVIRDESGISMYYRQPGETDEDWILVPHNTLLNHPVSFDSTVRVGLVTYGFEFVSEFTGGCDAVHVISGSYA